MAAVGPKSRSLSPSVLRGTPWMPNSDQSCVRTSRIAAFEEASADLPIYVPRRVFVPRIMFFFRRSCDEETARARVSRS